MKSKLSYKLLLIFNICIFFGSSVLFADSTNSALNTLTVISDKAPLELKLLTSHLAKHTTSKKDIINVVGYCKLINEDLKSSAKVNVMFMLKSEIYRGILNNQYLKRDNGFQISSTFLNSINQKLQKNKEEYSDFSLWLGNALLSDLLPYQKSGLIDRYQSIDRTDFSNKEKANKIKKILSFTGPWLGSFEKLSPKKFNQLCTSVAIDVLRNISSRTYYFGVFANKYLQQEEQLIFDIPKVKILTDNQTSSDVNSVSSGIDQQVKRKEEAKKLMDSITPSDSPESISKEIDKILPNKNSDPNSTWVPE